MPEFKKKSVRFDHLEPTYTSYSTQSEIQTYDLEDMLKQIARAEPMDTKKIIDGDSYIFHVCKYHDEDGNYVCFVFGKKYYREFYMMMEHMS